MRANAPLLPLHGWNQGGQNSLAVSAGIDDLSNGAEGLTRIGVEELTTL